MNRKERRKYIRIATVLPVEFFIADASGKKITPWIQGFTCDIGKGGICLTVNDLWWGFWDRLKQPGRRVFLRIKLSFKKEPLFLEAKIKWLDVEKLKKFYQYKIGLNFITAKKNKAASVFRFALCKKVTPILIAVILGSFFAVAGALFLRKRHLALQNRRLVSDYGKMISKNTYLAQALVDSKEAAEFFSRRKKDLRQNIKAWQEKLAGLESEYAELKAVRKKDKEQIKELAFKEERISQLSQGLRKLEDENKFLKEQIAEKEKISAKIEQEAKKLSREKHMVSEKVIAGMYDWIKHRQDLRRGLVLSYEGDENMARVCFTYDQALSVFVFLQFDNKQRAQKILDFYLNEITQDRRIYNGYYTDGSVFEYVRHSGPKPWLGLAALKYVKESGDKRYLRIAQHIADFLIDMQDQEGGVIGGPEVEWYSTEHNVDAYAFFRAFYQATGNSEYKQRALKVKDWLARYAYTDHKVPIKRGKGDATIATDTYAWSVTSLGPETLYSLGMDPEMILEFAEKKCRVTVKFKGQDARATEVEGFDFAKAKNIGRGGVVSGEWTAQMILAYLIMADYFKENDGQRYDNYLQKAHFYFNELKKMIITSPSRAGRVGPSLPYASAPSADTGHGWRTPHGNRTGSLASTAYFLIAYQGYNPLRLEKLQVSLKREIQRASK